MSDFEWPASADEWAEILEGPPGGDNHGRKRAGGGWHVLDPLEADVWLGNEMFVIPNPDDRPVRRRPNKPSDTIRHGTLAAYNNDRCRCALCRAVNASYRRDRRQGLSDASGMLPE